MREVWNWMTRNLTTMPAKGGPKPFPDYLFLQQLVAALEEHRILMVAKSRQMMATWTVSGWMLYHALHDEPGIYLTLSKGERDSKELLRRMRVLVENLPGDSGAGIRLHKEEVEFPSGARILSLPATEYAPRMHSPAGVFWDEMAFTPHSEGIWAAVKPAIDSGGSFTGVSTPNGTDNAFYELYSDQANGFGKHLLHWKMHPERGMEWEAEARRGLSDARWKQEYEVDFQVLADRVYDEYDPEKHTAAEMPDLGEGRIYRGIDFGFHKPYVIWAHLDVSGAMTVFAEWEGNDATVDAMAAAIGQVEARIGIDETRITWSACDPAGAAVTDIGISPVERLRQMRFKLRYRASEIATGVELVKSMLCDAAGIVRLKFTETVPRTLYHLRHYRWDEKREKPFKDGEHDHAMDALRYLIVSLSDNRRPIPATVRVAGVKR